MMGPAPAKLNLALVVGPQRADGKHELVTVFQRVDFGDRITVEPARETTITGFPEDTIVRTALALLDAPQGWRVTIDKHVPVAAGLGGGSSDAATALRLANEQLDKPVLSERLQELAAQVGADVPFFLRDGPQLGTGDGTTLETACIVTDPPAQCDGSRTDQQSPARSRPPRRDARSDPTATCRCSSGW